MLDQLKNLGLEESEAKVYLALLELGPSTVSEITKKAKITRTLGYHVLEKLGWSGLVNRASGKKNKLEYVAEHPRNLVQFVKDKKNSWEKRVEQIQKDLPKLLDLYKIADKPVIKFQDGLTGIKNIFSVTLEAKTEILSILDIEGWDSPELKQFGKNYNKERSHKKIKERILLLDTKPAREWMKYYKGSFKYTHYRWIKPEQLPGIMEFGGEINIYENKVVMALLKKPNQMGVIIENTALANILKAMFELAWQVGIPAKNKLKIKNNDKI